MEEAARKLQFAVQIEPRADAWELLGLAYGELNRPDESGAALRMAVKVKPDSFSAHRSLGIWYEAMADYAAAEREYAQSLALDSHDRLAGLGLLRVRQRLASQPK
jgi:tetratricopeptide (TPR) repeat protein